MLDKILQLYIGFCYLERLRTTPHYIQCFKKNIIYNDKKIGPSHFFYYINKCKTVVDPIIKKII